jgi:hypothetical protein
VYDGAVLAEPADHCGAHATHALDLGLHGRGHRTSECCLCVDGGRGGPSCSFTASAARRSVHVAPSKCHRVEYLLMPKAIDFTSISMHARPPGLPRVE